MYNVYSIWSGLAKVLEVVRREHTVSHHSPLALHATISRALAESEAYPFYVQYEHDPR